MKIRTSGMIFFFPLFLCPLLHADQQLTIVNHGTSAYAIVVSEQAIASEKHAAQELQYFLKEISGVVLPIIGTPKTLPTKAVILGDVKGLPVKIDFKKLGKEGFIIKTLGEKLIIAGGRPRGTLYGVYQFLEDYLGCRWYSSKVSKIPKQPTIRIPRLDSTVIPCMEYREPYYLDAQEPNWAVRNRVNGCVPDLKDFHGGKVIYPRNFFVHSVFQLIPPEKYFDGHPEYFALWNGKRVRTTHICFTNPEALQIAIQGVKEQLRANPAANIISVSQMDGYGQCECPNCKAVSIREGSDSGPVLEFVNQVADAIAQEYPDVWIDTIAYNFTRKPPRNLRPRPNVIIRLCNIEACCSHPLESCPENAAFRQDLVNWGKICNHLYVWDYVTDFNHYYLPFPNLHSLAANIRFEIKNGVKGIFEQGSYAYPGGGGEFAELRAYLFAKLLWNPDLDPEAVIQDFLKGYYGKAAKPIAEYIRLLHEQILPSRTNYHLRCMSEAKTAYLTPDFLKRAESLFQKAENLVRDEDPDLKLRVEIAHLPVYYAQLASIKLPEEEKKTIALRFENIANRAGLILVRESALHVKEFVKRYTLDRPKPSSPGGIVAGIYDFDLNRLRPMSEWLTELVDEASASLGQVVHLPNRTVEWSLQWHPAKTWPGPEAIDVGKQFQFVARVKVKKKDDFGPAFDLGVWDNVGRKSLGEMRINASQMANDEWKEIKLEKSFPYTGDLCLWLATTDNENHVSDIYVDKLEMVPVDVK